MLAALLALNACDDAPPGGGGGGSGDAAAESGGDAATDAPNDAEASPDAGGDTSPDASPDGDPGEDTGPPTCSNTQQCPEGQVCHPDEGVCTGDEVSCEGHEDCAPASHCNALQCIPSEPGSPCAGDDNCIDGEECTAGTCGCGGEIFTAEAVPPNMLIVLDRSGSMDEEIGGDSKWDIAVDAIGDILALHGDEIRFGLMLFPGEDLPCDEGFECGPGVVFVDPAADTAGQIASDLGDAGRCAFSTPIGAALEELVDYAPLEDVTRTNYVLLITDGQDNCEDSNPTATAGELLDQTPSIRTFVVGFGSGVDEDQLEDIAEAGGTATGGDPAYFQADDAAALEEALGVIAGSALGCSYALSQTPADPDLIFVYFGADETSVDEDDLVPRDETHAEGWDYDAGGNRVDFFGEACRQLREGEVPGLVISYGCALGPKD